MQGNKARANASKTKELIFTALRSTVMDYKYSEIVSALFSRSDSNPRVDVLVKLVLDLFMEVEALRETMIQVDRPTRNSRVTFDFEQANSGLFTPNGQSVYQRAYLKTGYITHNNAGPTGGLDKLLVQFYPACTDEHGRTWRECLLLKRLGFSASEIVAYKRAAEEAEMFT